jgi:hypothetical protein
MRALKSPTTNRIVVRTYVPHRHDKLRQLRRAEGRLALLEGARFVLHGREGAARPVLLWLDEAAACLCLAGPPEGGRPLMRLRAGLARSRSHAHLGSAVGGSAAATSEAAAAAWGTLCTASKQELVPLRQLPVAAVLSVRPGADLFPAPRGGGAGGVGDGGGTAAAATLLPDGARCFTVVCTADDEAGAAPAASGFCFQLPRDGNGRSRDEWVAAIGSCLGAV